MSDTAPLHAELDRLEGEAREKKSVVREARRRVAAASRASDELLGPKSPLMRQYGNSSRQPVSALARRSEDFLREIKERGLALAPVNGVLGLINPAAIQIERDAYDDFLKARKAVEAFKQSEATGLQAEIDEAEQARFKQAVAEGDLDAVRDVIGV